MRDPNFVRKLRDSSLNTSERYLGERRERELHKQNIDANSLTLDRQRDMTLK